MNTELVSINPFVRIDLSIQTQISRWPPCDYLCAAGCQSVAFPVCLMPAAAALSHSINCCCSHHPDVLHSTLCVATSRRQHKLCDRSIAIFIDSFVQVLLNLPATMWRLAVMMWQRWSSRCKSHISLNKVVLHFAENPY